MSIPQPSSSAVGERAWSTGEAGSFLPLAMAAAQLGGDVLRHYFRELQPSQVREKARHDLVSEADRASESCIVTYLQTRCPGLGFLAEESGATGQVDARWVLDPLDGTLNFVRGFPHFAVSIALVVGEITELGVIYDPILDEIFTARRGGGAFCNGTRIGVSGRESLAGAFVTTGFPYRVVDYLDTYLGLFRDVFHRVAAIRRPGAATLDLAHTAAGIFDAFFEFRLSPWDIAAGALLVREAGGIATNLAGGEDVFARGNIIAGSPAVQRELQELAHAHTHGGELHD